MKNADAFAATYVELWNLQNDDERRKAIEDIWSPRGVHYTPSLEAQGFDAIERRIAEAHRKWVGEENCIFVSANNAQHHHQGLRFNWHMMRGDETVSTGFDFVLLDGAGRILSDHQFIDPNNV